MKKQYTVSPGRTPLWRWVTTYHDGAKNRIDKVWVDDYATYAYRLEEDGYELAYTREEVQEAKEEYERKLARQLVEEKR